jgi:hypothetical protein
MVRTCLSLAARAAVAVAAARLSKDTINAASELAGRAEQTRSLALSSSESDGRHHGASAIERRQVGAVLTLGVDNSRVRGTEGTATRNSGSHGCKRAI